MVKMNPVQNRLRAYLGMSFPLGNVTKPGLPNCCSLTWWEICVLWWPWKLYELGLWSLVGSAVLATFWVKGQTNCNSWPTRLRVGRWVNVLSPHKNILLLKTNPGEVWRPYALWSVKMWGGKGHVTKLDFQLLDALDKKKIDWLLNGISTADFQINFRMFQLVQLFILLSNCLC